MKHAPLIKQELAFSVCGLNIDDKVPPAIDVSLTNYN
jgi:hypothetical protein